MNVQVPESWDEVPAASVDYSRTARDARFGLGADSGDAASRDDDGLVWLRGRAGPVNDGDVDYRERGFCVSVGSAPQGAEIPDEKEGE